MLRATLRRFAAPPRKFQVAVVGAGPGGCYVAHHLLKQRADVHIDVFEALPVPFGLSRYGVAPDHPEVKNVEKTFERFFEDRKADVNLLANVTIGDKGVPLKLLQEHYHAVVLAYGASATRPLGIEGEGLVNVLPAKRFVEFYNTMPAPVGDPRLSPVDLQDVRRVVIIGNGNVALDCARVLGLGYKHFCKTDINCFAAKTLMESTVEEIIVVGRRGVEHSAFTTKEFRELATTSNHCEVIVEDFELDAALERSADVRGKRRQLELMHKYCGNSKEKQAAADAAGPAPGPAPKYPADSANDMRDVFSIFKTFDAAHQARRPAARADPTRVGTMNPNQSRRKVYFTYNLKPVRITPNPLMKNKCGGVVFTDREGREVLIPCDAVLSSIGYKSTPMRGAPFDDTTATIPNAYGRVVVPARGDEGVASDAAPGSDEAVVDAARLYAAGWAKTGPRGVILTTMQSAQETANAISADLDAAKAAEAAREARAEALAEGGVVEEGDVSAAAASVLGATGEGKYGLIDTLVQRQAEPLSYAQVRKIWRAERQRGMDLGKSAEKVPSVTDMIDMVGPGKLMARRAKDRFLGNAPARPPGLELMEDWLDPETEMMDLSDPQRKTPELNIRL